MKKRIKITIKILTDSAASVIGFYIADIIFKENNSIYYYFFSFAAVCALLSLKSAFSQLERANQ